MPSEADDGLNGVEGPLARARARISVALNDAPHGSLIIVEVPTRGDVGRLVQAMVSSAAGRSIHLSDVAADERPVLHQANGTLKANHCDLLVLHGFERRLAGPTDRLERELEELDVSREGLAALPAVLVLAVTPRVARLLRAGARNLWSWRLHHLIVPVAPREARRVAIVGAPADRAGRERLEEFLPEGAVEQWVLSADHPWGAASPDALASASAIVVLVSPRFVAAPPTVLHALDVAQSNGVPVLRLMLQRTESAGLPLLTGWSWPPERSVAELSTKDADLAWADAAELLVDIVRGRAVAPAAQALTGERVRLRALQPAAGSLIGRRRERRRLHEALASERTGVVVVTGPGRTGKTALVRRWLQEVGAPDPTSPEVVLGWTFPRAEGACPLESAATFLEASAEALRLGEEAAADPWAFGRLVGRAARAQGALLVLDGLDPLQAEIVEEGRGRLLPLGVLSLIRELAQPGPHLAVVTTRVPVRDLVDIGFPAVRQIGTDRIPVPDGRTLLALQSVQGDDESLDAVVAALGADVSLLRLVGPVRAGQLLDELTALGPGTRITWVIERWLQGRPGDERSAIEAWAFFDGVVPIEVGGECVEPVVWCGRDGGELDPRVRDLLQERLKTDEPDRWREGHRTLYEDLIGRDEPPPRVVRHGWEAGEGQGLLRYRGVGPEEHTRLRALAPFFERLWSRASCRRVGTEWRALLEREAAHCLMDLGAPETAASALAASWSPSIDEAFLQLARGSIARACSTARAAMDESRNALILGREPDALRRSAQELWAWALHQAGHTGAARAAFEPVAVEAGGLDIGELWFVTHLIEVGEAAQALARWNGSERPWDRLAYARALLAASPERAEEAIELLDSLLDGWPSPEIRLTRAAARRLAGALVEAREDATDALYLAGRDREPLRVADAHLELARLALLEGAFDSAGAHVSAAGEIVQDTGYRRRQPELMRLIAELERGPGSGSSGPQVS